MFRNQELALTPLATQFAWLDSLLLEPGEGLLAAQGIDADDQTITVRPPKRVVCLRVRAADDMEVQAEKRPQFAFPVADEPRGRNDQDAADQSPHLVFASFFYD